MYKMKKMNDLPEDLVIQIQLRLHVKSLLCFKCVSKSWYARFQNSDFIQSHFLQQKARDGDDFDNSFFLLFRTSYDLLDPNLDSGCFTKIKESNSTLTAVENINIPFANDIWAVAAHCMGVFCIRYKRHLALWNPATREFKFLPQVYRPKGTFIYPDGHVCFGYDHKTSDFKVVKHLQKIIKGQISPPTIEVYSLNHNTWKEIPNINRTTGNTCNSESIFVNGFCHWQEDNESRKPCIASFDLTDETCRTISVNFGDNLWRLVAYGECLGAIVHVDKEKCIDIWKLNDIDNAASWMKQRVSAESHHFFSFWKSSQISMSPQYDDIELLLYVPMPGRRRILYPCSKTILINSRYGWTEAHSCHVYVESLVNIKGGSEAKDRIQTSTHVLSSPTIPLHLFFIQTIT